MKPFGPAAYSAPQRTDSAEIACVHYCDVIMGTMASKKNNLTIVYSTVQSGADQRNSKAQRHWHLCGEFNGDSWIPRTNGQ